MTKTKKQVLEMIEAHKDLFTEFREIHDKYAVNPEELQEKFNEVGKKIVPLVQRWENNLCSKSESTKYGKFSSGLADKFWTEVRTHFPKIDYVGLQKKS